MDRMAKAIAAALRVLNPAGLEPVAPAQGAAPPAANQPRDNCDKHPDNRDNFPPRVT